MGPIDVGGEIAGGPWFNINPLTININGVSVLNFFFQIILISLIIFQNNMK